MTDPQQQPNGPYEPMPTPPGYPTYPAPGAQPGFANAPTPAPDGGYGQPLVVIGDITVTQTHVITPTGTFPIANTQWSVTDMSVTTEQISQTGLILALVGFVLICALSLLFLLMKDQVTSGYIQVVVTDGTRTHVSNIPAVSPASMADISNRVAYARSLAAA
nr:hypothetical protein [Gordonia araii]